MTFNQFLIQFRKLPLRRKIRLLDPVRLYLAWRIVSLEEKTKLLIEKQRQLEWRVKILKSKIND